MLRQSSKRKRPSEKGEKMPSEEQLANLPKRTKSNEVMQKKSSRYIPWDQVKFDYFGCDWKVSVTLSGEEQYKYFCNVVDRKLQPHFDKLGITFYCSVDHQNASKNAVIVEVGEYQLKKLKELSKKDLCEFISEIIKNKSVKNKKIVDAFCNDNSNYPLFIIRTEDHNKPRTLIGAIRWYFKKNPNQEKIKEAICWSHNGNDLIIFLKHSLPENRLLRDVMVEAVSHSWVFNFIPRAPEFFSSHIEELTGSFIGKLFFNQPNDHLDFWYYISYQIIHSSRLVFSSEILSKNTIMKMLVSIERSLELKEDDNQLFYDAKTDEGLTSILSKLEGIGMQYRDNEFSKEFEELYQYAVPVTGLERTIISEEVDTEPDAINHPFPVCSPPLPSSPIFTDLNYLFFFNSKRVKDQDQSQNKEYLADPEKAL